LLSTQQIPHLDQQSLNLVLDNPDLGLQLTRLVGSDTGADNGPAHTACSAQGDLAGYEDVGDVLVLTEKWEVEENLEGLGVGGEDDELGGPTVEGLGGFVGSLLELPVVGGLLHEVEDLLGERGVREGEGFVVDGGHWG